MHIKRKRFRAYGMKKSESPLCFRSFFRFSARRFSAVFAVCDAVRRVGRPAAADAAASVLPLTDCIPDAKSRRRRGPPGRRARTKNAGRGTEQSGRSAPSPARRFLSERAGQAVRGGGDFSHRGYSPSAAEPKPLHPLPPDGRPDAQRRRRQIRRKSVGLRNERKSESTEGFRSFSFHTHETVFVLYA